MEQVHWAGEKCQEEAAETVPVRKNGAAAGDGAEDAAAQRENREEAPENAVSGFTRECNSHERKEMKVAVTTAGKTLDSAVELRFGRASSFLIYDTETLRYSSVDNSQQLDAAQGAGIQAAGHVVNSGVKAVISGHCGPKAMRVLKSAGIQVFLTAAGTVRESLFNYSQGSLEEISEADVEGHWV